MIREVTLTDPNPPAYRRGKPEQITLLYVRGEKDDWREFEVFRGTTWEQGIEVIPAETLDHALHGLLDPLLQALGRDPFVSAGRVAEDEGVCSLIQSCMAATPGLCQPGGKNGRAKGPPACYDPPLEGADAETIQLFQRVALAWRDGVRTLVVVGKGFNLR